MTDLTNHEGRRIRLTQERLDHILTHPEMVGMERAIEETLENPQQVIQSRSEPDVHLYYRRYTDTAVGDKLLCVIVKTESDAFIITAYLTDRAKQGRRLWQRSA